MRRRWAFAIALAGLVGLAVWLGGQRALTRRQPPPAPPPAAPVVAGTASRQDVPVLLRALGTVQAYDTVSVQSRVSGQITAVQFTQGQEVKAGDPLFVVDPRPYQAALDQAQGQLQHDQAVLDQANTNLARYRRLAAENSIARQQAEDQAYIVQQDIGQVKLDRALVDNATLNLSYCRITAPVGGRTGARLVDLGNYVSAGGVQTSSVQGAATQSTAVQSGGNPGGAGQVSAAQGSGSTVLVSITQIKPIFVTFTVPATELDGVRRHQAEAPLLVEASSQAGQPLGQGRLSLINNQVNTATGTVLLQATFANDDEALWPGAFVGVRLTVYSRPAVTVPEQTVMEGPDGSFVYVIGPGDTAQRVAVTVAARQDGVAVVEKGLNGGERVVVDGQYRLTNGSRVQVQTASAGG